MYFNGWVVKQDYIECLLWAHKAADQGNLIGINIIGVTFLNGIGVVKDQGEGAKWLQKAAELGSDKAQTNLGGMKSRYEFNS